MNFAAHCLLVVAASSPLATRAQFVVGDLSNALGSADEGVIADPNSILFEPQGSTFRQERPDALVPGDGFEALYHDTACGDHGCAQPTTVTTVVSPDGTRAQTTGADDRHSSSVLHEAVLLL